MDSDLTVLVDKFISGIDYQLWGVRWHQQGRARLLQVFIDREGGIDVDDCAIVSRHLDVLLDAECPQLDDYVLEVSSPGLDRFLFECSHFERYRGNQVVLRLHRAFAGRKNITAVIVDCDEQNVDVDCAGESLSIPLLDIKEARLQPHINTTLKVQNRR